MIDPKSLRYAASHEWVHLDGDIATIGISKFAVDQLTDLIVIDLPPVMVAPSLVVPWADVVEQTYLVVRRDVTPVALIRKAMVEVFNERPAHIVLNRSRDRVDSWVRAE